MKLPGEVLYPARKVQARVKELAEEIAGHYRGRKLTLVALMNGSVFFVVDLMRRLPAETALECWRISSYKGTRSTGKLVGLESCRGDLKGRDVLILDDVLDTGLTLHEVKKFVATFKPRSTKVCVLLRKKGTRRKAVRADWVGFDIGKEFVIGYGLDMDERFRSLPMIRVIRGVGEEG